MTRPPGGRPERTAQPRRAAIRRRLRCRGVVQGVGFRPAVWRLASALELTGGVRNDTDGATIEIEGQPQAVARFRERLRDALPPLARIEALESSELLPCGSQSFEVERSDQGARGTARIPPDVALCDACRAELADPTDRRHRYPFTTCTDCGPRFTLVRGLPYDRERTSMADFPLCPACAAEYDDPATRRFHAEPICCPDCGPPLVLEGLGGELLARDQDALAAARAALTAGRIVALQGLGGFQLACRADVGDVVGLLRRRKHRSTKPFALMVRDIAAARRLVRLEPADEELLRGPRGPIVLAPRLSAAAVHVAPAVAPGIEDLGVMLPTTPLHVELFRDAPYTALVMTSGNLGDEPICRTPDEARGTLGGLADLLLAHGREVVRRADDSVVRTSADGPVLVRRSRGWIPEPLPLPEPAPEPLLALGGHLQTTACLAVGDEAFPSQHVGDLDGDAARAFLVEVGVGLEDFLEVRSRALVTDEHPDYPSAWIGARLAEERGGRLFAVQHHLAHAAAVLGEHGCFPAIGERVGALVLDGTGYGPDGTAWGGECLLLDGSLAWRRAGHLAPLPLIGGERAVREPWRVALAALARAGHAGLVHQLPLAGLVEATKRDAILHLAARGGWTPAHGAGRLFEAAGALLGLCVANGWEGEAAARLEACAAGATDAADVWPELVETPPAAVLPSGELLVALARRVLAGETPESAAAGFHATFARLAARMVRAALPDGVRRVAVGGGCLVNRLLRDGLRRELAALAFEPLFPRSLPPGDGGLSYGQAVVASAALARQAAPRLEGVR